MINGEDLAVLQKLGVKRYHDTKAGIEVEFFPSIPQAEQHALLAAAHEMEQTPQELMYELRRIEEDTALGEDERRKRKAEIEKQLYYSSG